MPRRHVLHVLNEHGDTQYTFDPQDPVEVDEIERRFRDLMERGFSAFDVSTQPGRRLKAFDPRVSEMIVTPRYAGG